MKKSNRAKWSVDYTPEQIQDIISYANYCIKEGYMEDELFEMLDNKDYAAIDALRNSGHGRFEK